MSSSKAALLNMGPGANAAQHTWLVHVSLRPGTCCFHANEPRAHCCSAVPYGPCVIRPMHCSYEPGVLYPRPRAASLPFPPHSQKPALPALQPPLVAHLPQPP